MMAHLATSTLNKSVGRLASRVVTVLTWPLIALLSRHLISPLLISIERFDYISDTVKYVTKGDTEKSYDFIIVGAGSSGCTLAHFLAKEFSVLLLEAGGDIGNNLFVHLPATAYNNMDKQPLIYPYKTVPQKSASFGCNDNRSAWPAGRGLGGSSLLNGMIYIRGNNEGYNDIARRVGDSRWELKNIIKKFQEIENYRGRFDKRSHGEHGGMIIEGGYVSPYISNFLKAGEEFNLTVTDPNPAGPLCEGCAPADYYMNDGRRWDNYNSYVRPILKNENLTVVKYAHVKKVLMKGRTAYGVLYDRHGSEKIAVCDKEVILSAGAIATPKILILSGIGPREHLRELNVSIKIDLPVGETLSDKYGAIIGPFYIDKGLGFQISRDTSVQNLLKWLYSGGGPLASSKTDATFTKSSRISKMEGTSSNPDMFSYILSFTPNEDFKQTLSSAFNYNEKALNYFMSKEEEGGDRDAFFQMVCLASPKGLGTIKLPNTDPYSLPLIDPKYLQHDRDVNVLVEAIRWAIDLVENAESFKKINAKYNKVHSPYCKQYKFKSDKYLECLARHSTMTGFKYGGTVPIGSPSGDKDACVDSHFRIIGAKRLRVIDGSVLQEKHVSVNDATCRMLGKLGADIIKSDWTSD